MSAAKTTRIGAQGTTAGAPPHMQAQNKVAAFSCGLKLGVERMETVFTESR